MRSRLRPEYKLLAQGALVVLPVALLSALALYSLRQDKASIEQDARERATALAAELARRIGPDAGESASRMPLSRGIVNRGQVLSPPDYAPLPLPPEWPTRMTPAQSDLWRTAREAQFGKRDASAAARALRSLAASDNPAWRWNAEYELLLLESKRDESFVRRCLELAGKAKGIEAESGASVSDLCLLLAVRSSAPGPLPKPVAEAVRASFDHPSFLTAEVVAAEAPGSPLKAEWDQREKTLARLRQVAAQLADSAGPREIAVASGGERGLALCDPTPDGWRVALLGESDVSMLFSNALRSTGYALPGYAGFSVEIAGERWVINGRPQVGRPLLAQAQGTLAPSPPHPFTVRLELTDVNLLYASYRRRLWLTGGLILSATLTALIGLTILWQGSRRQARLSEMKSNFVSSVSHELRAPIASVRLMAESLDRGVVSGEAKQKEYFGLIVRECRRLSSLVENVLDFSRIDQGRKEYRLEPVDAVSIMRQAAALMAPYAAERKVALDAPDPSAEVAALRPKWDAHAIEQSLVNLIDNAIKHSPEGAAVRVTLEAAGPRVLLSVEDRGPGIPPGEQARIFDLFYRLGSELRRETQGAGIGLSIVKHVAEAHGGRVLVKSEVGRGSRFTLELPA